MGRVADGARNVAWGIISFFEADSQAGRHQQVSHPPPLALSLPINTRSLVPVRDRTICEHDTDVGRRVCLTYVRDV